MERLTNHRRVGPILGGTNGERSAEVSVTNDKRRESQGLSLHSLLPNNLLSSPPTHKWLLSTTVLSAQLMVSLPLLVEMFVYTQPMFSELDPIQPHKRCG